MWEILQCEILSTKYFSLVLMSGELWGQARNFAGTTEERLMNERPILLRQRAGMMRGAPPIQNPQYAYAYKEQCGSGK
jgi:hypothetical protein